MTIHGVNSNTHVTSVHGKPETKPAGKPEKAENTYAPEDTVEISSDAQELLANEARQANPKAVADSFGYKNFGQLVKAIRHSEGGEDISISGLVHQDAETISQVQTLFAPPEADVVDEIMADTTEETTETTPVDPVAPEETETPPTETVPDEPLVLEVTPELQPDVTTILDELLDLEPETV